MTTSLSISITKHHIASCVSSIHKIYEFEGDRFAVRAELDRLIEHIANAPKRAFRQLKIFTIQQAANLHTEDRVALTQALNNVIR